MTVVRTLDERFQYGPLATDRRRRCPHGTE